MRCYFDHNATTPPDAAVVEVVARALQEDFGNPSSVHYFGQRAKALLDEARSSVADLIGAEPAEVVFTSGGTESDNLAIRGAAEVLDADGTPSPHHEQHRARSRAQHRQGAGAPRVVGDAVAGGRDSGLVSPAVLETLVTDRARWCR